MLRRAIGEDVELETVLAESLGSVRADPGQVEQVLLNLVVNAHDAMPQGGTLTIETTNVQIDGDDAATHSGVPSGPYVRLAVTDSGSGMTETVKRHLFEPFFTTKGPGEGTGLGLAVVHGVIQQSDGHIVVLSEEGVGTTFHIYLPCLDDRPSAVEVPYDWSAVLPQGSDRPSRRRRACSSARISWDTPSPLSGMTRWLVAGSVPQPGMHRWLRRDALALARQRAVGRAPPPRSTRERGERDDPRCGHPRLQRLNHTPAEVPGGSRDPDCHGGLPLMG